MSSAEQNIFDCPFNNRLMGIPAAKNTMSKFLKAQCATFARRRMFGTREYLRDGERGAYEWYSYEDFFKLVFLLAKGLEDAGFCRGDRVGIIAANRVEWSAIDFACSALGVVLVPLYDTQSLADIQFVVKDAGIRACFCALDKLERIKHVSDKLESIIVMDDRWDDRAYIQTHAEGMELPEKCYVGMHS